MLFVIHDEFAAYFENLYLSIWNLVAVMIILLVGYLDPSDSYEKKNNV